MKVNQPTFVTLLAGACFASASAMLVAQQEQTETTELVIQGGTTEIQQSGAPLAEPEHQTADRNCVNSGNFTTWLQDFKQEAEVSGISAGVISSALNGIQLDPSIIRKDRAQGVFSQSFLQFSSRMVSQYRLDYGRNALKKRADMFARIEQEYGVPGAVLASFWGLETDFGQVTGNSRTLPALATLAYDCRRSSLFREHLLNALQIIERGDLSAAEMRGAWAGELGQMQFLPKEYNELGVDFDNDGRRDLIKSSADALASGASLLRSFGWRAGEPWLQEVIVPADMDWSLARINTRYDLPFWQSQGVTAKDGSSLVDNYLQAALLLPMGKDGPAFLAYPNFDVYLQWNQSLVYSTTAAYFATRLAGESKVRPGNADVTPLSMEQTKQLQQILVNKGYDVGDVDGIIGNKTREAVRGVQRELGMAEDGYPTPSLLNRL